jgi:hypothetical protein
MVVKDSRIPPRGFTNAAFEAFDGAPVGAVYADGQHWDEVSYPVGEGAVAAEVTLWYQTASREYVEFLRDANTTNAAGFLLFDLWEAYGKSEPVAMARGQVEAKAGFAEKCRKSVGKALDRYRMAHDKEWARCFETEGRGLSCDTAARDAKLAEAEAALRDALGGEKDKRCGGQCTLEPRPRHCARCLAPRSRCSTWATSPTHGLPRGGATERPQAWASRRRPSRTTSASAAAARPPSTGGATRRRLTKASPRRRRAGKEPPPTAPRSA